MTDLERALAELAWLERRGHKPPYWRLCVESDHDACDTLFLPSRSDQVYCCGRCRNRAAVRRYR